MGELTIGGLAAVFDEPDVTGRPLAAAQLLDPAEARAAEALVVGRAGRLTPAGCGRRSPGR